VPSTPTLVNHVHTPNTGAPGTTAAAQTPAAGNTGILSRIWVRLPDPALSGNTLVLSVRWSTGVTISSIVDDMGNTWSLCTSTPVTDTTNKVQGAMYYASNVLAGTRLITIAFAGYEAPTYGQTVAAVIVGQWCGVGAYDGGVGTVQSSSTTWTSTSFTPTTNGDLVITTGWTTPPLPANTSWAASANDGTTFTLLSADIVDSFSQGASAYGIQTTAASIAAAFTLGAAHAGISMACAFKAATAGTARPAGIQIVRIQGQSLYYVAGSDTINWQMPCSGNLLVACNTQGANISLQFASQSTNWTNIAGGSSPNFASMQYLPNVSPAGSYSGTLTTGSVVSTITFFFYDIAGAATSSTLGANSGTSGTTTGTVSSNGYLVGTAITPTAANSLVIHVTSIYQGSCHGNCGDPSLYFFDYSTYPELNDSIAGQASPFCENNGMTHVYTRSTTALQMTYSTTANSSGNVGSWSCAFGEFLAATPTATTYAVATPPTSPVVLTGAIGANGWYDWQCPNGATNVVFTVYGPGGAGGNVTTNLRGTGGGGGGGCTVDTGVSVSSSAQNFYTFGIGGGGYGPTGVAAFTGFESVGLDDAGVFIAAQPGTSAVANSLTHGAGGATDSNNGRQTVHAGGAGGNGIASDGGGGGGGGAGTTGTGGTGGAATSGGGGTGGTAGAAGAGGTYAGAGGAGKSTSAGVGVGVAGNSFGGGGGGSYTTTAGGAQAGANGAPGGWVITFTMPAVPTGSSYPGSSSRLRPWAQQALAGPAFTARYG